MYFDTVFFKYFMKATKVFGVLPKLPPFCWSAQQFPVGKHCGVLLGKPIYVSQ
jgi:hypothetical protein